MLVSANMSSPTRDPWAALFAMQDPEKLDGSSPSQSPQQSGERTPPVIAPPPVVDKPSVIRPISSHRDHDAVDHSTVAKPRAEDLQRHPSLPEAELPSAERAARLSSAATPPLNLAATAGAGCNEAARVDVANGVLDAVDSMLRDGAPLGRHAPPSARPACAETVEIAGNTRKASRREKGVRSRRVGTS